MYSPHFAWYSSIYELNWKVFATNIFTLNMIFDEILPRDWASSSPSLVKLNQLAIDCQFKCKEHFAWITIDQPTKIQFQCIQIRKVHHSRASSAIATLFGLLSCGLLLTQFYSHFYGWSFDFMTNVHSIQWKSNKMIESNAAIHNKHSLTANPQYYNIRNVVGIFVAAIAQVTFHKTIE